MDRGVRALREKLGDDVMADLRAFIDVEGRRWRDDVLSIAAERFERCAADGQTGDLPGLEELKGTGLLDSRLPSGFSVPTPSDDPALRDDEDPLEIGDLELALAPAVEPEAGGEG